MEKDLAEMTATEEAAKADFAQLSAAKEKEKAAATKAIEEKTGRLGDTAVSLAELKNDLEDTREGLAEDKKFFADLDKNCALKTKEWEAYKKVQGEELVALADTIKVLNDDDALELFKKTLPAGASFMQLQVTSKALKQRALKVLRKAPRDHRIDFVQVALHGGKMGFDKIIGMIDKLVGTLKTEQGDDDDKKAYCLAEFDKTEDTKKGLELDISDLGKAIEDGQESIATLASEIKALTKGIKDLDSSVSEATATRKQEHDDHVKALAGN